MATVLVSNRRKERTRKRLKQLNKGNKPLLKVFRSNQHIQAQVVCVDGKVVAFASTCEKELQGKLKSTSNKAAAEAVGKLIAERAKEKKVASVVFDRGAYIYHGRVAALADAARAGGLEF